MASVNKLIIVGHLGGDPELKALGENQLCTFSVATNEEWKDKNGQDQKHVEWTNVTVWGKRGENCAKYLKKGSTVYVEGRKRTRSWEKDGHKFYGVELVADNVTFLDSKGDRGGSGRDGGSDRSKDGGPPPSAPQGDDIPF